MNTYSHEVINDDTRLQLYFTVITSINNYSPLHWHGHLEIIFILKGYMTAYINDQKYTLSKNDLLIVNPKELHTTRTWGETQYILLQIPYSYLTRVLDNVSLIHFQEYFPSITMNSVQKKLGDYLFELASVYRQKEDGYLLHFSSIVYEFLYVLYKNFSHRISREMRDKENRNFERMEEVLQYVRSNYKENITLEDVSGLLHVSPEYFCRLFKKHTGQTFLEYLNTVRMFHFYQELLATDYSVTELMERNGITNYKVFSRSFKDTYGAPPSQVRKQLISC